VGTEILLLSEVTVPKLVVACESEIQISPAKLHSVTTQKAAMTNTAHESLVIESYSDKGHESPVMETNDLTLGNELVCLYAGNTDLLLGCLMNNELEMM
jgi:hypothetical protein